MFCLFDHAHYLVMLFSAFQLVQSGIRRKVFAA